MTNVFSIVDWSGPRTVNTGKTASVSIFTKPKETKPQQLPEKEVKLMKRVESRISNWSKQEQPSSAPPPAVIASEPAPVPIVPKQEVPKAKGGPNVFDKLKIYEALNKMHSDKLINNEGLKCMLMISDPEGGWVPIPAENCPMFLAFAISLINKCSTD